MGFKPIDVVPIASYGPTATSPTGKYLQAKLFQITRADIASTVKCVLPADSTIISFAIYSTAVSNAGTTAVVNVGNASTANFYVASADVKTAAGRIALTSNLTNIYNLESIPLGSDIQISGQYVETGAASSSGGPYYVLVEYVR